MYSYLGRRKEVRILDDVDGGWGSFKQQGKHVLSTGHPFLSIRSRRGRNETATMDHRTNEKEKMRRKREKERER